MLRKALHEITEDDLRALQTNAIPEGLRLDYKVRLDLSTKRGRLDLAADVAAMANTEGGRLVYGVEETEVEGWPVAGRLVPLTDPAPVGALLDIVHSVIDPPPRIGLAQVPIASGGFILVVEVQRAWADLHMVAGYAQGRYYRRGPKGNVLMSQSEVREAYARILKTKADLDAREAEITQSELQLRKDTDESIIVTALYGHAGLLDPREIEAALSELRRDVFPALDLGDVGSNLKLAGDGFRGVQPWGATPEKAGLYLAVLKNGVVHASHNAAFHAEKPDTPYNFYSFHAVFRILRALAVARLILSYVGYGGPARLRYVLRSGRPFYVDRDPYERRFGEPTTAPAGVHSFGPVDADIQRGALEPLAKEVIDPVFHLVGELEAPWFETGGLLTEKQRQELPEGLRRLL